MRAADFDETPAARIRELDCINDKPPAYAGGFMLSLATRAKNAQLETRN